MLQVLRVLALLPTILAAKIRREERRAIAWLRARGAIDASRGVALPPAGTVAGWVRQRLVRGGVIKGHEGRQYLDEVGYDQFRRRRRHRALAVLALFAIAFLIALYRGDITL